LFGFWYVPFSLWCCNGWCDRFDVGVYGFGMCWEVDRFWLYNGWLFLEFDVEWIAVIVTVDQVWKCLVLENSFLGCDGLRLFLLCLVYGRFDYGVLICVGLWFEIGFDFCRLIVLCEFCDGWEIFFCPFLKLQVLLYSIRVLAEKEVT